MVLAPHPLADYCRLVDGICKKRHMSAAYRHLGERDPVLGAGPYEERRALLPMVADRVSSHTKGIGINLLV